MPAKKVSRASKSTAPKGATKKMKSVKAEKKAAPIATAPKIAKTAKPAKAAPPTPAAPPAEVSLDKAKKALAKEKGAKDGASRAKTEAAAVATGPLAQKWNALFKKSDAIESKPYNMKQTYNEKTAIVHKVLGWGYILANRNDRLEVLFKDGIKYLISNYK